MNSSRRISPGCTGFRFFAIVLSQPLVIVHHLHFIRMPITPHKAGSPLVVDANAVLIVPVAFQPLQSVSGVLGRLYFQL